MHKPLSMTDNQDHLAYVKVWSRIAATLKQVRGLAASAGAEPQAITELRQRLRTLLAPLRDELAATLGKSEAYELLLPLVIYCDEVVLNRLAKPMRPAWPLLQAELFQINDGGERFFQLADEKLQQAQAPQLLLEVLYYCLGCGFLGRYVSEPAKVLPYKTQLAKRLQLDQEDSRVPSLYRRAERKARAQQEDRVAAPPGGHLPLIAPVVLYLSTLVIICALPAVLLALSNLRLFAVPDSMEPKISIESERDSCLGAAQVAPLPLPGMKLAAKAR